MTGSKKSLKEKGSETIGWSLFGLLRSINKFIIVSEEKGIFYIKKKVLGLKR